MKSIYSKIPNLFTITRILLIPIIVATFYFKNSAFSNQLGAFLFLLASVTDFIDGYIARKYNLISSFGKIFDPIADKLLVVCVIVMLLKNHKVSEIPCIFILARELIVSGLREFLAKVHYSMPVSRLTKIKTFIQMASLTLLILGSEGSGIKILDQIGEFAFWIAAILTLFTGLNYLKLSSKHF